MANTDKVKVIRSMAAPTAFRDIRSFVDSSSCYQKFVPNFSEIAATLIMLNKEIFKFEWTKESQTAFEFYKKVLPLYHC